MSQFLAPIHTWLFHKILVLENIEKDIAASFDNDVLTAKHEGLLAEFGPYIPDAPLDTLIDTSNIHGWLQASITRAETRQAALVHILMDNSSDVIEGITNVYYQAGIKTAKTMNTTIDEPVQIFNALNNVLLEGMPCDRVNQVVEQNPDKMVWKTQQCVHKNNWESNGVDVAYFYAFREAFSKGFVETISSQCSYSYSNVTEQLHELVK